MGLISLSSTDWNDCLPSSLLNGSNPWVEARGFVLYQWRRARQSRGDSYGRSRCDGLMGLLYALLVDTADATTSVQIEANSKEEALETGKQLYPGCCLAMVKTEPGDQL